MSNCTETKLMTFSKKHYTYINQFFGDETVREIISELYSNAKYDFEIQDANEDFESDSFHHILVEKDTGKEICSVDNGIQNMNANKNDTLCQSYTLLMYFGHKIPRDRKKKQMLMIQMYRKILKEKKLMNKVEEELLSVKSNATKWTDYTKRKETYIPLNKDFIIKNIKDLLNKWESYGYLYFIGSGHCK